MDWNSVGVSKGTPIANSTAVTTSDGRIRMYFHALRLLSAISDDGMTFKVEGEVRLADGTALQAGHPKVTKLSDGRLRLYTGVDVNPNGSQSGIISYVSSDGLTFAQQSGVRISKSAAGMDRMSWLTTAPSSGGGYRGYFSNLDVPGGSSDRIIKSAASTDLLNWTVDPGVRVGTAIGSPTCCSTAAERGCRRSTLVWGALHTAAAPGIRA